jgi:4-alpha-glucanotransferase
MRFPSSTQSLLGVALPVSALRTAKSAGVGEFADLVPFAEFCAKSSIGAIQLLPINDTGTESSPYSALSAFALHPIYVRLEDVPGASAFSREIDALRARFEPDARFRYREVRDAKDTLLRRIFDVNEKAILADPNLASWIEANPWVREYAVFKALKRRNFESSWKSWDKMRTPTHAEIERRWESASHRADHVFFAWVQMALDAQLARAAAQVAHLGIALKGDIPILMNEDSADVWANPELFRDDLRAGSPPDADNPLGQNWGFPIYNWDSHRSTGFSWWRSRLERASRYYHAFRIDHVLGFFRVWSIPRGERTGALGWPTPHEPITAAELAELGFSGDRLRWISRPHVPTSLVEEANGRDYLAAHGQLREVADRIGNEELWLFKESVSTDSHLARESIPASVRDALLGAWRDRLLVTTGRDERGRDTYAPAWRYQDSTAWRGLSGDERAALASLFARKEKENDELWRRQGEELLGALVSATDMLPCAEDLGAVPPCVAPVLATLGVLSLRVFRWERRWAEPGSPFRPLAEYPELSVSTTSVHDSSTFRAWWEREGGREIARETLEAAARSSAPNGAEYSPDVAAFALSAMARAPSRLFIPPLRDLLDLSPSYRSADPDADRINVPGTVTDFNWTWRMPVGVEELSRDKKLIQSIETVSKARRARSASE